MYSGKIIMVTPLTRDYKKGEVGKGSGVGKAEE